MTNVHITLNNWWDSDETGCVEEGVCFLTLMVSQAESLENELLILSVEGKV